MNRALPCAGLAVALAGCAEPGPDCGTPPGAWHALVVHAPFDGDATVATVADDGASCDGQLGLPGSDWVTAVADGAAWLVGRKTIDAARRYADLDLRAPTLEFSVGQGSNPHALVSCGGRILVTRYDAVDGVAFFDPTTGALQRAIDLTPWADGDGSAEPDGAVVIDDVAWIGLQRLDRQGGWRPADTGRLLAVDCAAAEVIDAFPVAANPFVRAVPGEPLVQIDHDAGIDLFDPATGLATRVVDDAAFGAHALALAWHGPAGLLVAERDGVDTLWCVDRKGGRVALDELPQRAWGARAAPDGSAWVIWRDHWDTDSVVEPGGVGVYDPVACAPLGWHTFGSDPVDLSFVEAL